MIRDFDEAADIETLAALWSAGEPEPITVGWLRSWLAGGNDDTVYTGVMATDAVAYAHAYRQPWHRAGEFTARVMVAEEDRRRGIGTRLLAHLEEFVRVHHGTALVGVVRDDRPEGQAFARQHGFKVRRQSYTSILDLDNVREAALYVADPPGIRVVSLAQLGVTEPHRQKVWQISDRTYADEPSHAGAEPRDFASFCQQILDTAWFDAAATFVAVTSSGAWAGIAIMQAFPETNSWFNFYTGVEREFRGRGVAQALKRATIRHAMVTQAGYLRTRNDSANAPMLAINRRYGFRAGPGQLEMLLSLDPASPDKWDTG
jgi:GNAT superfamily N-acetyltransferase